MSRSAPVEALADVTPLPRQRIEVLRPRSAETGDDELVSRAQAGEEWALEMLYRRHVALVAATARRLLRNATDTEDVVQETFLLAFERLGQLKDPGAIRGWLARIAVSRAHRRFRWRRLRSWFGRELERETLESQADPASGPELRAELALLDLALEEVPPKLRVPWILRHVVGHSIEDTAQACGCSLATVKRRISAAEALLQRHIGGAA